MFFPFFWVSQWWLSLSRIPLFLPNETTVKLHRVVVELAIFISWRFYRIIEEVAWQSFTVWGRHSSLWSHGWAYTQVNCCRVTFEIFFNIARLQFDRKCHLALPALVLLQNFCSYLQFLPKIHVLPKRMILSFTFFSWESFFLYVLWVWKDCSNCASCFFFTIFSWSG